MAETRLPQVEIVGHASGDPPRSGRLVEDPWMRIREVHFGDDGGGDAVSAVVTYEGPFYGTATLSNDSGNPSDAYKLAGETTTNRGGAPFVAASYTFAAAGKESFDDLASIPDVVEIDPVTHEERFVSAATILERLQSQYPGILSHTDPVFSSTAGRWFSTFLITQKTKPDHGNIFRLSTVVRLTEGPPYLGVGLHTQKLRDEYTVANINSVKVIGYAPQESRDPDNPPPPLTFEPQTDGTVKVTGGVEKWSYSNSLPDWGQAEADVFVEFDIKGAR